MFFVLFKHCHIKITEQATVQPLMFGFGVKAIVSFNQSHNNMSGSESALKSVKIQIFS